MLTTLSLLGLRDELRRRDLTAIRSVSGPTRHQPPIPVSEQGREDGLSRAMLAWCASQGVVRCSGPGHLQRDRLPGR